MPPGNDNVESMITYGNVTTIVLERLREMVISGQLKPGQWLKQDELAERFGVSTMPVREALRRLEAEGIMKFYPRRGARVIQVSAGEMEELWSIREELAVLACRWVGQDMARIPLERLRRIYDDLSEAVTRGDIASRMALSREFFFVIFEASQKQYIVRLLSMVWDASFQYRLYYFKVASKPAGIGLEPYYHQILRACESQDSDALVRSMRETWQSITHSAIHQDFVQHLQEMERSTDDNS